MEIREYLSCITLVCIILICSSVYAQDICVKRDACSCVFPNGTGFDLSESAKATFFTAQMYESKMNGAQFELSTYYYHPCFDSVPNINATKTIGGCGDPVSACRRVDVMNLLNTTKDTFKFEKGDYEFMGTSNLTEFVSDGQTIVYNNGPSATLVMLVCAATDDRLEVYSLQDPRKVALAFYSRNSCLQHLESAGRSLGTTLLIIFFSMVVFYIVLGICTKKFLMGAQGIEVVPNLAFWSDLPNLVKDGWMFTLNGFKLPARSAGPAASPDPNSYDSI